MKTKEIELGKEYAVRLRVAGVTKTKGGRAMRAVKPVVKATVMDIAGRYSVIVERDAMVLRKDVPEPDRHAIAARLDNGRWERGRKLERVSATAVLAPWEDFVASAGALDGRPTEEREIERHINGLTIVETRMAV